MAEPLAYFLTWGTYGTWLPGDQRSWVEYRQGWKPPDPARELEASSRMKEEAYVLTPEQRVAVEEQIAETCQHRGWILYAVNCRSKQVHVVVTASIPPEKVRDQLKAWCTRMLKTLCPSNATREYWWAERGSQRYLNDEDSLDGAIRYVRDYQDVNRDDE